MSVAAPAALAQFSLIVIAFLALMHAYVTSDFSLANVWENSHSAKPLLYKISGVWGNHEGSMVLWVLILALFGSGVALFGSNLPLELKSRVLAIQGSIGAAFLLVHRRDLQSVPAPRSAADRRQWPQSFAAGSGARLPSALPLCGLCRPFGRLLLRHCRSDRRQSRCRLGALGQALDARRLDVPHHRHRHGLVVGLLRTGLGRLLVLGSGRERLLHALARGYRAACIRRSSSRSATRSKIWTILLAILAFSLSLIGTFLVRSGVLTSVHAFAVDPARGVFILMILLVFIGGALTLFAWRAPVLKAGGLFAPMSREGGLVINNLLLCVACAAVFIGTLYPLALETLTGEKISVGPPYFNLTFGLIMLPLLLLVPVGPLLTWKRAEAWPVIQRLWAAALVTLAVTSVLLIATRRGPWLAPFGVALGLWLILGALVELAERIALFRASWTVSWSRLRGLPRSSLGMTLAHAGVGVAIIGIFAVTTWREEHILAMKAGDKVDVAGYEVTYLGEAPMTGPNYAGDAGRFRVMHGNREVAVLASEKRRFRPSNQETTEVGLLQAWSGDLYAVMGDRMTDGTRAMRIYFNPLVSLIWLGTFVMFLGGLISLTDRRFRVGAPSLARRPVTQAAE